MIGRRVVLLGGAATVPALAGPHQALAADGLRPEPIRIGALFPLTAAAASGAEAKAAIDVACEIINTAYPDLPGLPLAAGAGLPNLGGALLKAVHVDHQDDSVAAQSQAQRLIASEHVIALLGACQSSVALTATAVAERYGIPFVVSESVAANITSRGLK